MKEIITVSFTALFVGFIKCLNRLPAIFHNFLNFLLIFRLFFLSYSTQQRTFDILGKDIRKMHIYLHSLTKSSVADTRALAVSGEIIDFYSSMFVFVLLISAVIQTVFIKGFFNQFSIIKV